ncbi:hypothetical protein BJ138DRAFT_1181988 [Hygrophoropsis aurantiaca]|uniref:Uncharacterized protein n=1 Tax=Hygrophoropsis aurantiaca TaxID=72124 RepID=A0ACB8A416_9AGAM|nr:hypothetical protein BJ138DRAFT_1181988 [Hygrophoropsis aurantiaca]
MCQFQLENLRCLSRLLAKRKSDPTSASESASQGSKRAKVDDASRERDKTESIKPKKHVKEFVLILLCYRNFEISTSTARNAPNFTSGDRTLYILVFRKLLPAKTLGSEDFGRVWWQCVLCHKDLWNNGVHHRDISLNNLMCYKKANGEVVGVLNDFDLASLVSKGQPKGPQGNQRTGTPPFMALELLTPEGLKGEIEHLYRHDLESFFWVLVFFCLQYENGKEKKTGPLDAWVRVNTDQCRKEKNDFFSRIATFVTQFPSSNKKFGVIAYKYSRELMNRKMERNDCVVLGIKEPEELPEDVFKAMETIVRREHPNII